MLSFNCRSDAASRRGEIQEASGLPRVQCPLPVLSLQGARAPPRVELHHPLRRGRPGGGPVRRGQGVRGAQSHNSPAVQVQLHLLLPLPAGGTGGGPVVWEVHGHHA